jgi:hypothetical protein
VQSYPVASCSSIRCSKGCALHAWGGVVAGVGDGHVPDGFTWLAITVPGNATVFPLIQSTTWCDYCYSSEADFGGIEAGAKPVE